MATVTPVEALNRRSRGVFLGAGALLIAAAVMVALSVAVTRMTGSDHHAAAENPAKVPAATSPVTASGQAPEPELVLPQPTTYAGGIPSGFPRTEAGAVAAAYGYSRIATGLDVNTTLRTLETLSDPASGWFLRSRPQIADGLVAQRKSLGLPANGPVGSALIDVHPSGYRIDRSADAGVTVLTLNVVDTQRTDGTSATGTVVFRWALRWDGTRWLANQTYLDDSYAPLAVTPMTSQAVAKGWKVARGG
jgi:hypothetical protein